MAFDDDGLKFIAAETTDAITPDAKKEAALLESRPPEAPPNSVHLDLRFCKIKWHAESSTPLFCFVSMAALLVFGIIIALLAMINASATWPTEVFKFIGQAVLTLVGAVVGASASSSSSGRSRRSGSRS